MDIDLLKMLLGRRIAALRNERNLTARELAESVGIDPSHLTRIEVGQNFPSIPVLMRFVQVFGVTPNILLTGTDEARQYWGVFVEKYEDDLVGA